MTREALEAYMLEHYGLRTEKDLDDYIARMKKVNISVFLHPCHDDGKDKKKQETA